MPRRKPPASLDAAADAVIAALETDAERVVREGIEALLRKSKRTWTLEELSDRFDCGVAKIRRAAEQLADARVNVQSGPGGIWIDSHIATRAPTRIDVRSLKGTDYVFGATADNHLCSKYARMDVLNALYDLWAEMGVTTVYQGGNMIDGEARFNKGDLLTRPGLGAQLEYFVENWPQRKGITTYFVTGDDHEGWYIQREAVDFGRLMEDAARRAGREDIVYAGHMEHDFVLEAEGGNAVLRVIHAGGGSSYAYSYSVQKIVESYQGGEKPKILLVGHYHKAIYAYPREVHTVQLGCTEDQTPFMRKKKLEAHLGGWTIRLTQSRDGLVHGFTPRFDPFYDRDFYKGTQWQYIWGGRCR